MPPQINDPARSRLPHGWSNRHAPDAEVAHQPLWNNVFVTLAARLRFLRAERASAEEAGFLVVLPH